MALQQTVLLQETRKEAWGLQSGQEWEASPGQWKSTYLGPFMFHFADANKQMHLEWPREREFGSVTKAAVWEWGDTGFYFRPCHCPLCKLGHFRTPLFFSTCKMEAITCPTYPFTEQNWQRVWERTCVRSEHDSFWESFASSLWILASFSAAKIQVLFREFNLKHCI